MRSGGGSAAGAGCGVFGLLGLLIGVGLTVYLGSRALDSSSGLIGGGGGSKVAAAAVTLGPGRPPEGTSTAVASVDFVSGADITLTTCLAHTDTGPWQCDPTTATHATVDVLGELRADYPVHRVVRIAGKPVDCSVPAAGCVVRAAQAVPIVRIGSAPLVVTPPVAAAATTTPGGG